ncbi:MAG TPA: tripartite tricarboxylate transporter substrate binding protein [Ramlibacter sp.]|nr:tripartite tricarboxylate transporter substrate binding protein [Ramlibacter sp.]
MTSSSRRAALAALASLALPYAAKAQGSFPNKPIKVVVPFPAGGSTDAVVRILGERLTARWGQQIVVDNKPGAGGNIGAAQFARSDADGYNLLAAPPGPLAINHNLYKSLNYDPRQFQPVTMIANMPNVLVVGPSVQAKNLRELIAFAKANPGKLSYATQGNGSTSHLTAMLFQSMTGARMVHIPYKGSGPALTDMMAGRVDLMFDNLTTSLQFHQAKKVTILATATAERLSQLPDVPTVSEAGLPGFESGTWVGLVAPQGTPAQLVERIARDAHEELRQPAIAKQFAALGAEPVGGTPAATASFLRAEAAKWKKVIDEAGVTVE